MITQVEPRSVLMEVPPHRATGGVLVVDDEESIVWTLRKVIEDLGAEFLSCGSAHKGIELARSNRPRVIILDVNLPGIDGLTAMKEILDASPDSRIIVITAHGTLETAVKAQQQGAADYLLKPLDLATIRERLNAHLGSQSVSSEIQALRGRGVKPGAIVGHSPAMQSVFKQVAAVAPSDSSVLLTGPSGSGKELLARAIHENSQRAEGPFEAINCASIPETLLESELYGHEHGAFTGAIREKLGKLEMADGGTVFLDEIGDLPLHAQVKLLRFLEERRFEHVGGLKSVSVNVRVISATNQDLEARIRDGRFREDLYFRLNVVQIQVPPLCERRTDIPLLVAHFLDREMGAGVSKEALAHLLRHDWPGNVRELRNVIERGVLLARKGPIRPEHLPEHLAPVDAASTALKEADMVRTLIEACMAECPDGEIYRKVEEQWEEPLIRLALDRTRGNQVKASQLLGINRMTLRKKIDHYGILSH